MDVPGRGRAAGKIGVYHMIRWANVSVWGLVLCVALGVMSGAGGYTFYDAEGTTYLSDGPWACASGHITNDSYASWQKASRYTAATGNDRLVSHDPVGKHLTQAQSGYFSAKAFTFENYS